MKVERILAGDVMGDHRLVHMHRALRFSGRPRGKMNQRHVLRIRRRNLEIIRSTFHQLVEVMGSARRRVPGFANDQHVFQLRQRCSQVVDLAPLVERGSGDEHAALTDGEALMNRFGAESREKRAEDTAVF